jgi:hypothetical protein
MHKIPNTSVNNSKKLHKPATQIWRKRQDVLLGQCPSEKVSSQKKTSSKPCEWVMLLGEVQTCGCSEGQGCNVLSMGVFVEGELYLSWMHSFQGHSCPYSFYLFIYFLFIFVQELIRGHFPGMVTSGGNFTNKYFHRNERLAHDETHFPLAMQPRVTSLAW